MVKRQGILLYWVNVDPFTSSYSIIGGLVSLQYDSCIIYIPLAWNFFITSFNVIVWYWLLFFYIYNFTCSNKIRLVIIFSITFVSKTVFFCYYLFIFRLFAGIDPDRSPCWASWIYGRRKSACSLKLDLQFMGKTSTQSIKIK